MHHTFVHWCCLRPDACWVKGFPQNSHGGLSSSWSSPWLLLRLAVRIILGTWPLVDCLCGAFCCRRLLPAPSAARRPFAQCFRLRLLDRRRRLRRGDLSRRACERSRSTCLGENGELLGPSGGAIARSTCTQNNMHDFDADCIRKKTKPTYMCETNTEPRQQQLITLKIFPRRVYMKPTT